MTMGTAGRLRKTRTSTPGEGLVVVISAPSGCGKTSVLFGLLEKRPEYRFSVSVTTRAPRAGEREGVNYHFITREHFEKLRDGGDLLEWNLVHGNFYGTLKSAVDDVIGGGGVIILDAEPVGAAAIVAAYPDAVRIFFMPPSPEILRERLTKRNTETPERIRERLAAYPDEIARIPDYDYLIINDCLEDAIAEFDAVIVAEQQKTKRVLPHLTAWRTYFDGQTD